MISIVVAMDAMMAIGVHGRGLPWGRTLKDDLANFRKLTLNHTVIMGRRTFTDDLKHALPQRRNIILSRDRSFSAAGCEVMHSWDQIIDVVSEDERAFVIGGAEVFYQALPVAKEMYVTFIHHIFPEANVFFPRFNSHEWGRIYHKHYSANERNAYHFYISHLVKEGHVPR